MNDRSRLADRIEYNWRQVKRNGREYSVCRSIAFFTALAMGHYGLAVAAPTGGTVTGGQGTIVQQGPRTDIQQGSQRLDIDWTTFSTRPEESVNFIQPDQLSVAINRVVGGVPSHLRGALNANGRVFLLNTSGIVFHGSSRVNVGALLATTARDVDIDGDSYRFTGGGQGEVINHGDISVSDGGFAVLVAPNVTNTGYIQADLGTVALLSGEGFTLDLRGDGLINFTVDGATVGTVVNTGVLRSRSGRVEISVADAQDAVAGVINLDGVVDADAIADGQAGSVLVKGGLVDVTGAISADGGKGGRVEVLGDEIGLAGADISATGARGGGEILIGGDYQGKGATYTARNVSVDAGTRINADATENGDGGYVIVWSDGTTSTFGDISARGGRDGGDGGFIETSGKQQLIFGRAADASAPRGKPGTWLLDPENIDIGATEAAAIEDSLNLGNNVSVKTGDSGDGEGDISVNASITKSEGGDAALSMDAHGTIDVNKPITSTSGKLDVKLKAGKDVNINSTIATNGGDVSTRVTGVQQPEPEETAGGSIEVASTESGSSASGENAEEGEESAEQGSEDPNLAAEVVASQSTQVEEIVQQEPQLELTPTIDLGTEGEIVTGGGSVEIVAEQGTANIDGRIDASNRDTGQVGGDVSVFADVVNVGSEAVIDVSGDAGGGDVSIGGEFQGGGDSPTSSRTTVAEGAEIRADAVTDGDGGTVVVWSDGRTEFRGDISARGGAQGGDGGFIEVSGKEQLLYRGNVDATAPNGQVGTLMLDPTDLAIRNGAGVDDTAGAFVYEQNLEAAGANVLLVADHSITLENLADDELEMQYGIELRVRGTSNSSDATGFVVFEDLGTGSGTANATDDVADKISVLNRNGFIRITGGTGDWDGSGTPSGNFNTDSENKVYVRVGDLEVITPGVDDNDQVDSGNVSIIVQAGGPVEINNIRAEAVGSEDSDEGATTYSSVEVRSGSDITIRGNVEVSATQKFEDDDFLASNDQEADQNARAYLGIFAGSHSSGNAHVMGDIDVDAVAWYKSDASDDFFNSARPLAWADATAIVRAADDVTLDGNVTVTAEAVSSGFTDVYGAVADAYLLVWGGYHDSDGDVVMLGDTLVSADAVHKTAVADLDIQNESGAEAYAVALIRAADDIRIGQSAPNSSTAVFSDITVKSTARSGLSSDELAGLPGTPLNEGAEGFALSYLRIVAGTHSSGYAEINGNIEVTAESKLYNAGEDREYGEDFVFGNISQSEANARVDIYGAEGASVIGDVTVTALALSSGELNGDAEASADFHLRAGGEDPVTGEDHGSSSAWIYLAGEVLVSADATYKGDRYGEASAYAHVYLGSTGDIQVDGNIQVLGTALSSGTGDVYTGEDNIDDRFMGHLWDSYLADDANAQAIIDIHAGWHGSGSVDIDGNLTASADATLINAGYNFAGRVGEDGPYGDGGAEGFALAEVHVTAASDVEVTGDITIKSKALSSGEHNGSGIAHAFLDIATARSPYFGFGSPSSHSSAALTLTGDVLLSADGDYKGFGHGSAEGWAEVDLDAAGDITINGNVDMFAYADASGVTVTSDSDFAHDDFMYYLQPWRFFYLGADDGNAVTRFYADAGTHSGGSFEMSGDVDMKAETTVINQVDGGEDGYLICAPYPVGCGSHWVSMDTPEATIEFNVDAANDIKVTGNIDAYAKVLSSGESNQEADIEVYLFFHAGSGSHEGNSDSKIEITGNITATADAVYKGSDDGADAEVLMEFRAPGDIEVTGNLSALSKAVSSGEGAADADADADIYLYAGYASGNGSSNAGIKITGNINATADAVYKGSDHDSADAETLVEIRAAGDIDITGDIELRAISSAHVLDSTDFDTHVQDAEAMAYLRVEAGTHSGGSVTMVGNISVLAQGEIATGHYSFDENTANAGVEIVAANDVDITGDITVKSRLDIDDAGEGRAQAYLEIVAGEDYHSGNSSAEIVIRGDTRVEGIVVQENYSRDDYGSDPEVSIYADVWVDLNAAGDITVEGDIDVIADVTASGGSTGGGAEGAPYDVWADAYLWVYAGRHSSGDANLRGNINVDADVVMKVSDWINDENYYGADADAFASITAADNVNIGTAANPVTITVDARAVSDRVEDFEYGAEGGAEAWAYLRIEAGDHGEDGNINFFGDTRVSAEADYYGGEGQDASGFGEASAEAYFLAKNNISVAGDIDVWAEGLTSCDDACVTDRGHGDAYGGEGWATLQMVAGISSSGSLIVNGDITVEAKATSINNESSYDVIADADALLKAADDITLTGDVTVRTTAFSDNGTDADADARLTVRAGEHGSDGDLTLTGNVLVSADADIELTTENDDSADAYAWAYLGAADDIVIRGDVVVKADARASSDGNEVNDADADAYLVVYAGIHSSGSFDMTGNITIDADAYVFGTDEEDEDANADAIGHIYAANDVTIRGSVNVTADATMGEDSGDAHALAYLEVLGAMHGSGSSQEGDIFVSGDVNVFARAKSEDHAHAFTYLRMIVAESHGAAFDDDLTVLGQARSQAYAEAGGSDSDDGEATAWMYIAAGDDVIITPTVTANGPAENPNSDAARCELNGLSPIAGGEQCVQSASTDNHISDAVLTIKYHGELNPAPAPITPPTGGGGGGGGVVLPPVLPPLPPGPLDPEVIQRSVESWLAAIWAYPEYVEQLPPGVAQGFSVDPATGQVSFTQSFGDYFKSALGAGICQYMSCSPELEDAFGQLLDAESEEKEDPDLVLQGDKATGREGGSGPS